MNLAYNVSNLLLRGALYLFADWSVKGREHVPLSGPLIVVANHQSNMDPPLLAVSIPRRFNFMAKNGLFANPLAARFLKAYGAFSINQDVVNISAIQSSVQILKDDGALVVFPEGTRSPGAMKKAMSGVGMIAIRSGAPILPVGITGTESIGPPWQIAIPKGSFRINIGKPFSLPTLDSTSGHSRFEEVTNMIMRRVADLLPNQYQGVYASTMEHGIQSEPV